MAAGLREVHWPGRLEVLRKGPLVVADGAHNGDSARRLREALRDYFQYRRLILVSGVSRDKALDDMARELAPLATLVIATRSQHPRAANAAVVAAAYAAAGAATESRRQSPKPWGGHSPWPRPRTWCVWWDRCLWWRRRGRIFLSWWRQSSRPNEHDGRSDRQ